MNEKSLMETIQNILKNTWFQVAILLFIALISFFLISNYASSVETHEATLAALDDKKETVLELTGASTAASAAITLLPGDVGTPIADKLADLSGYFLFILGAIYLEKYLVTITGYIAFRILIPIACALLIATLFYKRKQLRMIALKLATFALLLYLVIPASVKISDMISKTYQASIEETIQDAKDASNSIDTEDATDTDDRSSTSDTSDSNESESFLSGLLNSASDKISDTVENVTSAASTSVENFENVLNSFIDAIAILIVTTCLIPLAVLLFFVWIMKMILNFFFDKERASIF